MQRHHTDRYKYFLELSQTSKKYFIPYISKFHNLNNGTDILEIGCGDGGNLLPFASYECNLTGIDISSNRINSAINFFNQSGQKCNFINSDLFKYNFNHKFDIIICHDVFEHISQKDKLILFLEQNIKSNGVIFLAFPSWQMPFGGHQQICKNKLVSMLPFIHLLPNSIYTSILKLFKENNECIIELLNIKSSRVKFKKFYSLIKSSNLHITNNIFWFINPHYETKFGLSPKKLPSLFCKIHILRNFMTTSYWCILQLNQTNK